jgi:hypothetical protein
MRESRVFLTFFCQKTGHFLTCPATKNKEHNEDVYKKIQAAWELNFSSQTIVREPKNWRVKLKIDVYSCVLFANLPSSLPERILSIFPVNQPIFSASL